MKTRMCSDCLQPKTQNHSKSVFCLKIREVNWGLPYSKRVKVRFLRLKSAAEHGKYKMNISFRHFFNIISNPCTYCGVKILGISSGSGIDRINSNNGYIVGNITSCCGTCNQIKNAHSLSFLRAHLQKMLITLERLK